jgi:hypothetical protein
MKLSRPIITAEKTTSGAVGNLAAEDLDYLFGE